MTLIGCASKEGLNIIVVVTKGRTNYSVALAYQEIVNKVGKNLFLMGFTTTPDADKYTMRSFIGLGLENDVILDK